MKKILVRVVSLTLMLALVLSMPVIAKADSIDLGVQITTGTDEITVTVDNSDGSNNILAAQNPNLTVDCSFAEAYVKYGDKVVNSTLADGKITFTVAKGGAYQIIKGSAPAGCPGCGSEDQYHTESCEAIVPADAKPLYAYNLDDNKTYTSISTSNNSAIPVIFRTSADASAEPVPMDDKSKFSFVGKGINLDIQEDRTFIQTGPYGIANGKVVYTAEDGNVYVLTITVQESERLLAVDSSGKYRDLWGLSTTPIDVSICYGTTAEYTKIPLSKLSTGGIAQLSGTDDEYTVCSTGAGEGGIYYTVNGHTEKLYVNGAGNWQEGSLTAKNSNGEEVSWPWITPNSSEVFKLFFGENELTSEAGLSAGGVATIAYSEADSAFVIGASGNGQGDIYYTVNGYTFAYSIVGANNGQGGPGGPGGPGQPGPGGAMTSGSVEVDYNGQPVRIGLGNIYNEAVELLFMTRHSFKAGSDEEFNASFNLLAVAYDPNDPTNTSDVDKQFYSTISNVRLEKMENAGAGSADNLQLSTPAKSDEIVAGADIWGFTAHADACQSFDANVKCTFDYQEKSKSEPVTLSVTLWLSFVETSDITVGELTPGEADGNLPAGMPDNCLDTAEELNFVLSGNGNLMDWIQCHYPDKFAKIGSWSGIHINLPAVTYDDIIEDKIVPYEGANVFGGVTLTGTSAGDQKTTMPGLICGDGVLGINGINFTVQSGKTMTFDGSAPFTCGILMDTGRTDRSSSGWLSGCSFQGFDYGIYCSKHGVKPELSDCLIRDCGYGLYINCSGLGEIDFPLSVERNRFVGCQKAVVIAGLPDYFSPYYLRIYHNAFLFNNTEFDVDVSGTFFFKLNYYGGHSRGHGKYEGWHPGNKGDAEIRHAARLEIANKGSTKVITNPCLKAEEHTGGYWMYNNHGNVENQHAAILNSETSKILIDSDAFNQNASESQIAILDENQNELAMWIFDGEEAAE